jgi:hypothetical protein
MMILEELFLKVIILFINNINVKGLYIDYNRELKLLEVYHFVFEHL